MNENPDSRRLNSEGGIMKTSIRDNIAKFFYDGSKVTLTILVVGTMARKPFVWTDVAGGISVTFVFLLVGAIIELVPGKEKE